MKPRVDYGQFSRRSPVAVGLSVLVHGALALALIALFRRSPLADTVTRLIVLIEPGQPVEHVMVLSPPAPAVQRMPDELDLSVVPRVVERRGAQPAPLPLRGGGRIPGGGGGAGELAPRYESGHLWVAPLPLTPEEIASRLEYFAAMSGIGRGDGDGEGVGGGIHGELIDSAVTAIVQSYLDSVAAEPGAEFQGLPSWTTEIAGMDFGIDQNWVYFAGLKIPAAVLALLPLPQDAGNYFRDRNYEYLMEVRREIYYSAWMADTRAEFKENVRKLRERRQHEREMAHNQLAAPVLVEDSTKSSTYDDRESGR